MNNTAACFLYKKLRLFCQFAVYLLNLCYDVNDNTERCKRYLRHALTEKEVYYGKRISEERTSAG